MLTGNKSGAHFWTFSPANGHRVVRSSSLVPIGDPTLLFTNAGMNQFKDVFLGLEQRDYKRATTAQKCVRAGGKHNDLENVGFTNRHHTFFEMLGNFSFGDYFKKDAVAFAWELVTSRQSGSASRSTSCISRFSAARKSLPGKTLPTDEEAVALWAQAGAPKDRVLADSRPEGKLLGHGRYRPVRPVQRNSLRHGPGGVERGPHRLQVRLRMRAIRRNLESRLHAVQSRRFRRTVTPLPKPSIDTGAGLERLAAVLQGKISNYDTDLFQPLIGFASKLCGKALWRGAVKPTLHCASWRITGERRRF